MKETTLHYDYRLRAWSQAHQNDHAALIEKGRLLISILFFTFKLSLGGIAVTILATTLPYTPGTPFYAALSASISVLYIASLMDISRIKEGVPLILAAITSWILLGINASDPTMVTLSLATHLIMSVYAILSRDSNSLQLLGLWPLHLGIVLFSMICFVFS